MVMFHPPCNGSLRPTHYLKLSGARPTMQEQLGDDWEGYVLASGIILHHQIDWQASDVDRLDTSSEEEVEVDDTSSEEEVEVDDTSSEEEEEVEVEVEEEGEEEDDENKDPNIA